MHEKIIEKSTFNTDNITSPAEELSQYKADTCIIHPIIDISHSTNANRLRDEFMSKVLQNNDYELCKESLYDIVNEFEANPNLILYFPATRLEDLIKGFLIETMFNESQVGELSDCVSFLFRYLQRYHHIVENEARRTYFAVPEYIGIAEYDNEEPEPPIKRIDMYIHFLGDFGIGAYVVVHEKDVLHIKAAFSTLEVADDEETVCAMLYNELGNALLYDMYEHSLIGGELPDFIKLKYILLKLIGITESSADYSALFPIIQRYDIA